MPAPRLLDKKVVNTELARQKKQQIDAGISIAKKVDAVRSTLQEEEKNLEVFRGETIRRIQTEIDTKVLERDELDRNIARRRQERMELEAPIDLKEAWREVLEGKVEVSDWRERLTNQSVQQLAREGGLETSAQDIADRLKEVTKKEKLTERTLIEAESKFEESSTVLDKAKKDAKRLVEVAAEKEHRVVERELAADERDRILTESEEKNQAHEIDLANREKALKVRYDTFIKAQAYIKSKRK